MSRKVSTLADILVDITTGIESRLQLFQRVEKGITSHYCVVKNNLLELEDWQMGFSRSIESQRSALKSQLDMLLRESRQEEVKCWEDIAALKKEFRTWFKQYQDVRQRVEMITTMGNTTGSSG